MKEKPVPKPWGSELWLVRSEHYLLKKLRIKKSRRLSLQYHEEKSEHLFLESGLVFCLMGPSMDELKNHIFYPGEVIAIPPGTIHRISALEDSVVIEVSTPQAHDVVRLKDDYGRA